MYAFISGKLVEKNPAFAVIEANGVGYMIHISLHTYSQLKDQEACRLYTHLSVKEDALTLYGFHDEQERRLFRDLISVSGVGPNTARMILSSLSPAETLAAITAGRVAELQKVKGIGAKTAQRIIIDLGDKLSKEIPGLEKFTYLHNTNREEALSGLLILGFPKSAADKALGKIMETFGTDLSVEKLIKEALKVL